MNFPGKLNSQQSRIVLSSDWHVFHKRDFIWKDRGFNSIFEHAKWIRDEYNSLAADGKDTIVIYLGDGFLNTTPEEVETYFHGFAKNITFIYFWGNHESAPTQLYKKTLYANYPDFAATKQQLYPLSWNSVIFAGHGGFITIDKTNLFVNHFSNEIWDGIQHDFPHAFGHSHGSLKSGQRESLTQKKLDVGVDNTKKWFNKPYITWEQFLEIIKTKRVTKLDHHDEKTDSGFTSTS